MGEIQTYKREIEIEILNFKKSYSVVRRNSACLAPLKTGVNEVLTGLPVWTTVQRLLGSQTVQVLSSLCRTQSVLLDLQRYFGWF